MPIDQPCKHNLQLPYSLQLHARNQLIITSASVMHLDNNWSVVQVSVSRLVESYSKACTDRAHASGDQQNAVPNTVQLLHKQVACVLCIMLSVSARLPLEMCK